MNTDDLAAVQEALVGLYHYTAEGHMKKGRSEVYADGITALDRLSARLEGTEWERDDYRLWNERVRVCANHTQDVAAPAGDCLICNLNAAEAREKTLRDEFTRREAALRDAVEAERRRAIDAETLLIRQRCS